MPAAMPSLPPSTMLRMGPLPVAGDGIERNHGSVGAMAEPGMVDLAVIGGGVNGAGIARDAAGRGLSVVLCEKGDLAEGTSSRSGKLVHGGLRYLEYLRVPPRPRGADRARGAARRRTPHRLADALRAAALARAAPGLAGALGPVPLRPSRRPQETAADAQPRPRLRARRRAAQDRNTGAPSNIPTAGWTTPASSSSTPSTRASAARRSTSAPPAPARGARTASGASR